MRSFCVVIRVFFCFLFVCLFVFCFLLLFFVFLLLFLLLLFSLFFVVVVVWVFVVVVVVFCCFCWGGGGEGREILPQSSFGLFVNMGCTPIHASLHYTLCSTVFAERLEAIEAAEKSRGMAVQQDVSDMHHLDRVWNSSFDSVIWAAKAKVRAQRRRPSSSGDRRGSGQLGALGSDGPRLSKTGTELAETAGQQPEQGAPSPVTQTGTCPSQQQDKVPPLKQPETERPKKQEKPPERVAQKLLVEYSPSS